MSLRLGGCLTRRIREEKIAGGANRSEETRLLGIALQFTAKLPHMHVNSSRIRQGAIPPNHLQQFVAEDHPLPVADQVAEHLSPGAATGQELEPSSRMETPASQEVLAKGVTVTGEIHSSEPLTIEGEVDGTIDVTGQLLTIAPNGNVRASVKAREIDVLGSLEGNVEGADRVLYPQWRAIRGPH
jgi:hypothetical protein